MKLVGVVSCLSTLFLLVCTADELTNEVPTTADHIDPPGYAEPTPLDMCQLEELAGIVCDICAELSIGVDRTSCCIDENTLYECERTIMLFSDLNNDEEETNEVEGNTVVDNDDDYLMQAGKRAAWSWKKPTSNRYNNALNDIGFRGKRFPISSGRAGWKPTNYYLDKQISAGFRGKRMEEQESEFVDKRMMPSRWDWKPAAYLLSNPYRYDRINYMGKRGQFSWKPIANDDLYDRLSLAEESLTADKRARYPGRYDWKPAPYRMDSDWGMTGKRTSWYGRRPSGRYHWKPYGLYGQEKRGNWDWKPANNIINNRWRMGGSSYMGKRFVPTSRVDWKPSGKNRLLSFNKRGRFDWKPTGGYFDFGQSSFSGELPGKRPAAQFDWKPSSQIYRTPSVDKRDRYSQSWKPWKPATYIMDRDQWFG